MRVQVTLPLTLTEAAFQQWVLDAATLRNWRLRYHTHDSRRSPVGFPDLVLIHPCGDIVVAELKAERGRPGPGQQEWIDGFNHCGIDAYLWRPSDGQQIVDRLMNPRHRGER